MALFFHTTKEDIRWDYIKPLFKEQKGDTLYYHGFKIKIYDDGDVVPGTNVKFSIYTTEFLTRIWYNEFLTTTQRYNVKNELRNRGIEI